MSITGTGGVDVTVDTPEQLMSVVQQCKSKPTSIICDISKSKGYSTPTPCPLFLSCLGMMMQRPHPHTDLIPFPYPFPKQRDTEVNFLLPKGLELGSPMVVHDKSEVCVHSHGDEDAALQDPLPAERKTLHLPPA